MSYENFMTNIKPAFSMVYGVSNIQINTTSKGLLQGLGHTMTMVSSRNSNIPCSFEVNCLPAANMSLFSVGMAVKSGHSVEFGNTHSGSQQNLLHYHHSGLYILGGDEFIPFLWDDHTQLWWLTIKPKPDADYGSTIPATPGANELHGDLY